MQCMKVVNIRWCCLFQGRQAMEWSISNIKNEMDELAKAAQAVSQTAQNELLLVSKTIDNTLKHLRMDDSAF